MGTGRVYPLFWVPGDMLMDRKFSDAPSQADLGSDSRLPPVPESMDGDGSWGFLPLSFGLAVLCLALFFLLSPPLADAPAPSDRTDATATPAPASGRER